MEQKYLSDLFKRKITVLLIAAILCVTAGCGYSKEEKAQMKGYEEMAKKNAMKYIEEKYGFSPEITGIQVLKVNTGPVPDFSPPPTGMVNVSMKYGDISFITNITGEESSIEGKDSYQKAEITSLFSDRLECDLGISISEIDVAYADDCLINEKYDDLNSFINGMKDKYVVETIIKTLDDISEDVAKKVQWEGIDLLVISCRNEQAVDILKDSKYLTDREYRKGIYSTAGIDKEMLKYSLFTKGYVFKRASGDIFSRVFEMQKVSDDVYFVYDSSEDATGAKMYETKDMAPASDWSRASGKAKSLPTFENPVMIGKAYGVEFGNLSKMQIYIKQEKREKDDKAERYIALQYIDEDGHEVFDHIGVNTIDGVYTFNLDPQDDMKIVVMINKQK